ncbi:MAG TPA: lipid-binding SYLF domain-containing protein [Rhizomicrobium sp.]|nr:lipid-binding SYLF domain-containing protein [Rhizomicrobium sp.]
MKRFANLAAAAAVALTLIGLGSAEASPAETIAHTSATIADLKHDPVFGNARATLRNARAVLIVPRLVKGGFIFGAEGGEGVLMARTRHGWSQPAFYSLGSASFGLQIGIEQAELVMFIMSDRALRGIEQGKVKLGAGAGLTVVTLGASAEAATPANLSGDIVLWSIAKGAYGGITLNGSVIAPEDDTNAEFYGRSVAVHEILSGKVSNPQGAQLARHLSTVW